MNLFSSVLKGAWLAGSCLLTAAVAQPQERLEDFRTLATVQTASNEGLQRLSLPLAVMQQSRSSDLADLRVFDAQGRSVPVALGCEPESLDTPEAREVAVRAAYDGFLAGIRASEVR